MSNKLSKNSLTLTFNLKGSSTDDWQVMRSSKLDSLMNIGGEADPALRFRLSDAGVNTESAVPLLISSSNISSWKKSVLI